MLKDKKEIETRYADLVKRMNERSNSEKSIKGGYHELFVGNAEIELDEVNAWTYWQGRGVRHPRIILLGQDWGSLEEEKSEPILKAVAGMLESKKVDRVHYFDSFVEESSDEFINSQKFATDKNLSELFKILGYEDIVKELYSELFFTNLISGYRKEGKSTGGFRKAWITEQVKADFRELVSILRPQVILCLGKDTFVQAASIFGERDVLKGMSWNGYLDSNQGPIKVDGESDEPFYLFALPHPGYYGTRNRGKEIMQADWKRVKQWLDEHENE